MKGTKFYKIVIVLLLLVNTSLLVFMWMSRPPHPPYPPGPPGQRADLAIKIGLTGDSKTKVDALEKAHHEDKRKLMDKSAELHHDLFDLVGSDQSSDAIMKEIELNQQEIEKMTFDFFDAVAAHCNESQLEELKKFIDHALVQVGHRPPPPPPPAH